MQALVLTPVHLLLILLLLLLLYVLHWCWTVWRAARRQASPTPKVPPGEHTPDTLALEARLRLVEQALAAMQVEQSRLRFELADLAEMGGDMPVQPALPGTVSGSGSYLPDEDDSPLGPAYQHAMRLARQGMDADQLMRICAISRGEAELMVAMQRTYAP